MASGKDEGRALTVRVSGALYKRATVLADVEGVSLSSFVQMALEREITTKLGEGGEPLHAAVDAVSSYRSRMER